MIEIDTILGRKCTSLEERTVCMSRILVLIALESVLANCGLFRGSGLGVLPGIMEQEY
jgi:hypothetical protein